VVYNGATANWNALGEGKSHITRGCIFLIGCFPDIECPCSMQISNTGDLQLYDTKGKYWEVSC
jgi:hypothetical protein